MPAIRIPDDLVQLLVHQRIIPFIGAGFSAGHDVPNWEALLGSLAEEIQSSADIEPVLSYEEISKACRGDNLQIAEYLYLIAGESIGPIRHALSTSLQSSVPLLESTPHVELTNLGAPHVYTTNFDDLIEKTYRALDLLVDVISVPRDMARSHADRTEVVKYHGDLRHEQTLVLTESQYYDRLEFESPMDLKFRSDLLGRSVLFMGYSFRDINIRVIWFRLMQMMEDVPVKDRPPSYIVRLRRNPVLDVLYESVGLRTLVIDPDGSAETTQDQNAVLSEFLMELSLRCSPKGTVPGSERPPFMSVGLLDRVRAQLDEAIEAATRPRLARTADGRVIRRMVPPGGDMVAPTPLLAAIDNMKTREITGPLVKPVEDLLLQMTQTIDTVGSRSSLGAELAAWFMPQARGAPGVTVLILRGLLREDSRDALLASKAIDWSEVWNSAVPPKNLELVMRLLSAEIAGHEENEYEDDDVAYAIDILKRLSRGELVEEPQDEENLDLFRARAKELLERAQELYPSTADYEAPMDEPPNPREIRKEIEARAADLNEGDKTDDSTRSEKTRN